MKNHPVFQYAQRARVTNAEEDGIVLVDYDKCIGCKYCSWACPYGAREIDEEAESDEEMHAVCRSYLR